jgi:hypothetical protein
MNLAANLFKNNKMEEGLTVYFPFIWTYRIENEVSNNSSVVAGVFIATVTF